MRAPGSKALFALTLITFLYGCAQGLPNDVPDATLGTPDSAGLPSDGPAPTDASATDGSSGCQSNADCASALSGPVCNIVSGRCVLCSPSNDTCPPGQYCDAASYACTQGCTTDADCGSLTHCNPSLHACVGCMTDSDCAPGTVCASGVCTTGCTSAHACGVGSVCCGSACVNTQTVRGNCGACGTRCVGSPGACCGGACTVIESDNANCGGCGVVCSPAHATGVCASAACTIGSCATGYQDCDHNPTNGCEAAVTGDVNNCGTCGNVCPTGPNATARCVAGACTLVCAGGYGHCATDPPGACATPLATSPTACGSCGTVCPGGPNATATCVSGACGIACTPGYGDCDGMTADGCEADLGASPTSCGGCGVVCAPPNAVGACSAGACAIARCAMGYADCDHNPANGCELATAADNANCGGCGVTCPSGTACSAGACTSVCAGGTVYCTGRCITTATDPTNCGACGTLCATGAEATPTCTGGSCGLSCAPGYGDCDGVAANGCETSLRASVANCGACGSPCVRANAIPACIDGACHVVRCNPGYANCSGTDATGCETNIFADALNCGACGSACNFPNAGALCSGGACSIAGCSPGYRDCNGVASDGCEVSVNTDNFNCGGCGVLCPPGTACAGGVCSALCTGATTFCSGSCVDTSSDSRNCGACGHVCASGLVCTSGACVIAPPPNDTCAGAQWISLATSSVTIATTTVGAHHDMTAPCDDFGGTDDSGADVFFAFTLPGPASEMVYADTLGSTFDTILFFANNCGGAITSPTTAGDAYCNDDVVNHCTTGGLQSQAYALLGPGTHYLVLSGFVSANGPATLHFQHIPVGNGPLTALPAGSSTRTGTTVGAGVVAGPCGGGGPDNSYWWSTCPEFGGGTFSANTCSGTSWDTLIYLKSATGVGNACDDDGCGVTGLQSSISATVGAGAGLHVFTVDGWSTLSSGAYTLGITRP